VALEVESTALDRDDTGAPLRVVVVAAAQTQENVRSAHELHSAGLGTSTQVPDAESLRVIALTNRNSASFDLTITEFRAIRALDDL